MREVMDLHIYTNNSPQGRDKVLLLCEAAAEKNVDTVAFTDVCRIDALERLDVKRRMRHAYYDTAKARELFSGTVNVLSGIEFEQAYRDPAAAAEMLGRREYDIVLSAVTRDREGAPFALSGEPEPAAFADFSRRYAELLLQTVEETDFDVLSRPLAPLRGIRMEPEPFEEAMHEVLRALAAKGRALEAAAPDLLGSERVRDLYMRLIGYFRSVGGERIVIGSESLCAERIGTGVELTAAAVKRAGFSAQTFYKKRTPCEAAL